MRGKIQEGKSSVASDDPFARIVAAVCAIRNSPGYETCPIVIVIDELDQVDESLSLAGFLRSVKETLLGEGVLPPAFLAAGQKCIVERMRREHESLPRSFDTVWVPLLNDEECEGIIVNAESDGCRFDPIIRGVIARSARGFPAVVQKLADACVTADDNGYIDLFDFQDGVVKVVSDLKAEGWLETLENDDVSRQLLMLLSTHNGFSSVESVSKELSYPEQLVVEALTRLGNTRVVEREDDGYRIRDRLLAAYISLEETRHKDFRELRQLKAIFEEQGWDVRGITPHDDDRGIDLIACISPWLIRRAVGVKYIGQSDRLDANGIAHLVEMTRGKRKEGGLEGVRIIGKGQLRESARTEMQKARGLVYYPWEVVGEVAFSLRHPIRAALRGRTRE